MKCPKCKREGAKYTTSRKKRWKGRSSVTRGVSTEDRTDFTAKCIHCKWKGEIK